MEWLAREAKDKLSEDTPHWSVVFQEQGPVHNIVDAHIKHAVELHQIAEQILDMLVHEQGIQVASDTWAPLKNSPINVQKGPATKVTEPRCPPG